MKGESTELLGVCGVLQNSRRGNIVVYVYVMSLEKIHGRLFPTHSPENYKRHYNDGSQMKQLDKYDR